MRLKSGSLAGYLKTIALGVAVCGFGAAYVNLNPSSASLDPQKMSLPKYTDDKQLMFPEGYHSWVFVGASIGLSYVESAPEDAKRDSGPGAFHHVYIQPEAYAHFQKTGQFPEKTMLVMEVHRSEQKVSPNKQGYFEGERAGIEVALKDHEKFEEGWAYFNFGNGRKRSTSAFPKNACWSCHNQHGATDNVFTQFYPILRDLDRTKSTAQ